MDLVNGLEMMILNGLSNFMMINIYYSIWVDAISSMKKHHPNDRDWKVKLLLYISWIQAINWWIIFIWLRFFDIFRIPLVELNVFPGTLMDSFVAFALQFGVPFIVLNYMLIFHRNKYRAILEKYKTSGFRFAPVYSFSVLILAFATAIVYGMLT